MKNLNVFILFLSIGNWAMSAELSISEKNEIRKKANDKMDKVLFEKIKNNGCFNTYFSSLLDLRYGNREKLLKYSLCLKRLKIAHNMHSPSSLDDIRKNESSDEIQYSEMTRFPRFCLKNKDIDQKRCYEPVIKTDVNGQKYQDNIASVNSEDYDSMEILYKLQQWE